MIKFGVPHITRDEIQITKEILNSKWLTTVQNVLDFGNKFKKYKKLRVAIGVSSCTAAFICVIFVLKKGDSFSFYDFLFSKCN